MPVIPNPIFPPEAMPWVRWAQSAIEAALSDARRKGQSDDNTNSAQSSTMSTVIQRLGDVQNSINSMISIATFDASQVTTGAFNANRIPTVLNATSLGAASSAAGDLTVFGHVYVPNSTLASFGSWTIAYIDGDGRLTRGASSRRFKENIVPAPEGRNYFQADVKEFTMKGGNGQRVLGYIAEDLVGTDMERFVVFERADDGKGNQKLIYDEDGNRVPLSIDWIPLIIAQNDALRRDLVHATDRLEDMNMRVQALEDKINAND